MSTHLFLLRVVIDCHEIKSRKRRHRHVGTKPKEGKRRSSVQFSPEECFIPELLVRLAILQNWGSKKRLCDFGSWRTCPETGKLCSHVEPQTEGIGWVLWSVSIDLHHTASQWAFPCCCSRQQAAGRVFFFFLNLTAGNNSATIGGSLTIFMIPQIFLYGLSFASTIPWGNSFTFKLYRLRNFEWLVRAHRMTNPL